MTKHHLEKAAKKKQKSKFRIFLKILIVIFCVTLITAVLQYATILNQLEDFLIAGQPPEHVDIIIVISGDSMAQKVVYGVKLYQQGYANKILLSGGPRYWNTTDADVMKQHAVYLGIPTDSIILEKNSVTTYHNAKNSLNIIIKEGFNSAIVVTSPCHSRRAQIIFEHLFDGKGIDLTICSFEPDTSNDKKWWQDELSTQFIVNEYLKLLWDKLFAD